MSDTLIDAEAVAVQIATVLERRGISYAIGGALAYGVWAIPRGTADVDLNVFVGPEQLERALDALLEAGVTLDRGDAAREALDGGQFKGWAGPCRIDVFTPSIEFSWEAERTRVRSPALGTPLWFLSAEALAVFKLLFFRTKDIPDLERMLAVRAKRLDAPYVRRWISDMMGEDDPRVTKWDELVASFWNPKPA